MLDQVPHFSHRDIYKAAIDHPSPWVMCSEISGADPEQIMTLAIAYRDALKSSGDHRINPSITERFDKLRDSLRGLYHGSEPITGDYLADSALIQRLGKGIANLSWVLGTMSVKLAELAVITKTNQDEIFSLIAHLNDTLMNPRNYRGFLDNNMYKDACKYISTYTNTIAQFYDDWERSLNSFYDLLNDPRCEQIYIEHINPSGNINNIPAPDRFPPPQVTDPTAIRTAWDQLSKAEQDTLIYNRPDIIGNLAGLPCAIRDQANHILLTRDLVQAKAYFASHGITQDYVLTHKDDYKNNPFMSRYINALMTQKGLEYQDETAGRLDPPQPVLLLKYDPCALGWHGGAMTSIGNPDTAKNVAVLVPGTSNSVFHGFLSNGGIINAAKEFSDASGGQFALVTCMDYRSPDSASDMHIVGTDLAYSGAKRIKDDVNGLWVSHQGDGPHMTVIGHSYGATAVADACYQGMHTNDVIFLGSPGMDQAGNEHGLHLDHGHMYVGANSNDGVSYLGGLTLGNDPATLPGGGIRFHAESPGIHDPITDHRSYFDSGSESLYSMADISSGHADQLGQHGMLAKPRYDPQVLDRYTGGFPVEIFGPLTQDPRELFHRAHNNHYHKNDHPHNTDQTQENHH